MNICSNTEWALSSWSSSHLHTEWFRTSISLKLLDAESQPPPLYCIKTTTFSDSSSTICTSIGSFSCRMEQWFSALCVSTGQHHRLSRTSDFFFQKPVVRIRRNFLDAFFLIHGMPANSGSVSVLKVKLRLLLVVFLDFVFLCTCTPVWGSFYCRFFRVVPGMVCDITEYFFPHFSPLAALSWPASTKTVSRPQTPLSHFLS